MSSFHEVTDGGGALGWDGCLQRRGDGTPSPPCAEVRRQRAATRERAGTTHTISASRTGRNTGLPFEPHDAGVLSQQPELTKTMPRFPLLSEIAAVDLQPECERGLHLPVGSPGHRARQQAPTTEEGH